MTRKELHNFVMNNNVKKVYGGYCCYKNLPYEKQEKCIRLGSNGGVLGWNWTAYYNPQDRRHPSRV